MKILLLGNKGQLGWELERTLVTLGDVYGYDFPIIDLIRQDSYLNLLEQIHPAVVVNAAAYTAVDQAETEIDSARAINSIAPGLLAQESHKVGAAFIHFSTDYVFDGTKGSPYVENDLPNPLGIYGKSKREGEQMVEQAGGAYLILRTSWVYSLRRDSFVTKVLSWARQKQNLRLVDDQISGPTWARMLAEVTAQLLARAGDDPYSWLSKHSGLYHLAGSGYCSRKEWGEAILQLDPQREEHTRHEVLPAITADFPTPARRPLFSALDCTKFNEVFGLHLPKWEEALRLAMAEYQGIGNR